jgi:hypothetical protein
MTETGETTPAPVLPAREASRRAVLLGTLRDALAARQVESVLALRHRLVLHADSPCGPSGPADPELYVLTGGSGIVTTDGTAFRLPGGIQHPVTDPAGAAALMSSESGQG